VQFSHCIGRTAPLVFGKLVAFGPFGIHARQLPDGTLKNRYFAHLQAEQRDGFRLLPRDIRCRLGGTRTGSADQEGPVGKTGWTNCPHAEDLASRSGCVRGILSIAARVPTELNLIPDLHQNRYDNLRSISQAGRRGFASRLALRHSPSSHAPASEPPYTDGASPSAETVAVC
jgi:hypothetical protein